MPDNPSILFHAARNSAPAKLADFTNNIRHDQNNKRRDDVLATFELFGAVREPDDVIAMLALLRARGQDADAYVVLEAAALSRPSTEAADLLARMEEQAGSARPADDAQRVAELMARNRTPRQVAEFVDRLADKHDGIVDLVLRTAGRQWPVRDLARLQLALTACGQWQAARSSIEHALHRGGEKVHELAEYQRVYGILDGSLVSTYVREQMAVVDLVSFVQQCARRGTLMGPEDVLIDVIRKEHDDTGRGVDDLARLHNDLQRAGDVALAELVTVEVARQRDADELVRYADLCTPVRQTVFTDLFEEVIQVRPGKTIGGVLILLDSKRSAKNLQNLRDLVAHRASVATLRATDSFLSTGNRVRLAVSLLRTALQRCAERFTPTEVAELLAIICRHGTQQDSAQSLSHAEGDEAPIRLGEHVWRRITQLQHPVGSEPNSTAIVRTTIRRLNKSFSERADSPVTTRYLAELAVAVTRTAGIPAHVAETIGVHIGDAVSYRDSRQLELSYVHELREAGGAELAGKFQRRLE